MIKKSFAILTSLFLFLAVASVAGSVSAATLKFDPATVSTTEGNNFDLKVNIDTEGENVLSADVYILYDADLVEFVDVAAGTFFPTVQHEAGTAGKLIISAYVDDPGTFKSGTGTVATVTFKAKSNGTSDVKFDCTQGSTTDSNIIKDDINATDIIDCDGNVNSKVTAAEGTVGSDEDAAPTSTPSASVGGTSTETPSELPQSGVFDNIVRFALPGIALFLIGVAARLLL